MLNLILLTIASQLALEPTAQTDTASLDLAAQADAIVLAEVKTRAERDKARKTEFIILDQRVIEQKDGRRLTFNRVKPPPRRPVAPPKPVSRRENVSMNELIPSKPQKMLSLAVTVFSRKLTQINWRHEGQSYTAYSNIDFNHMRGVSTIETPEATYILMMGIGNETDMSSFPDLPAFTPGEVEYFVITEEDVTLDPNAFTGIDALHAHFQEHEAELKMQSQRTDSLNAARKRYQAANPEEPRDTVINFWKKETNQ